MNFFHNLYIVFPRLSCRGGVFNWRLGTENENCNCSPKKKNLFHHIDETNLFLLNRISFKVNANQ